MIFIHKAILACKLETFENCKEVKHIMIIIIAIIYMFYLMWYLISNRKLLSENPQGPPEKIHSPHFTHSSPLKFQKVQVPSFLPTLKFLLWRDFTHWSGVSIVSFEQVRYGLVTSINFWSYFNLFRFIYLLDYRVS